MTFLDTADMTHNRKTAWSGKVLIPMWTIQIAATLLNIIGYICFLVWYRNYSYNWTSGGAQYNMNRATYGFISAVILVILWFVALSMIIFEIARFHKKNLPVKTMLTSQIILSAFCTICFLLEMVGLFLNVDGGIKTVLNFFATIVALAFFYGTLICTSVIYHRRKLAKRESKKSYGMTGLDEEAGHGKGETKFEVNKA
ncbi:hypothetical protein KCU95_g8363, partial [Aureobasidium melanogenum]